MAIALAEGLEDVLRPWSKVDHALATVVLGLVRRRSIRPDATGHVDVARSHDGDFARAHSGHELQSCHRLDCRRHKRKHRLDHLVGHGFDRLRLAYVTSTSFQRSDCLQAMQYTRVNEVVFDSLFERTTNTVNLPVDIRSAPVFFDHR